MLLYTVATACLVVSAAAHATFQELWVNGVDMGDACVRMPASNSPVTSVTSTDLACNAGAASSTGLCPVSPGDTVTVEMHQQPLDRSCATQAIGGSHYGPINIYLAPVSDATTAVGSSATWFKISEMGLPSSNPDYWATEVLNDNCGHYTFIIPTGIAPGNYLLRAEVIALHVASTVGGAQFYMSCYQLSIGGSGTASPSGVSLPGAYSAEDPGILIDIYQQLNNYTIPGPSPYATTSPAVATTAWPTTATWNTALQPSTVPTAIPTGSSGSVSTSIKSSSLPTVTPTAVTSTTFTPTTVSSTSTATSTSASTSASSTATAAHYAQCGGIGYTGPTVCASPYVCTVSNTYYSQCL